MASSMSTEYIQRSVARARSFDDSYQEQQHEMRNAVLQRQLSGESLRSMQQRGRQAIDSSDDESGPSAPRRGRRSRGRSVQRRDLIVPARTNIARSVSPSPSELREVTTPRGGFYPRSRAAAISPLAEESPMSSDPQHLHPGMAHRIAAQQQRLRVALQDLKSSNLPPSTASSTSTTPMLIDDGDIPDPNTSTHRRNLSHRRVSMGAAPPMRPTTNSLMLQDTEDRRMPQDAPEKIVSTSSHHNNSSHHNSTHGGSTHNNNSSHHNNNNNNTLMSSGSGHNLNSGGSSHSASGGGKSRHEQLLQDVMDRRKKNNKAASKRDLALQEMDRRVNQGKVRAQLDSTSCHTNASSSRPSFQRHLSNSRMLRNTPQQPGSGALTRTNSARPNPAVALIRQLSEESMISLSSSSDDDDDQESGKDRFGAPDSRTSSIRTSSISAIPEDQEERFEQLFADQKQRQEQLMHQQQLLREFKAMPTRPTPAAARPAARPAVAGELLRDLKATALRKNLEQQQIRRMSQAPEQQHRMAAAAAAAAAAELRPRQMQQRQLQETLLKRVPPASSARLAAVQQQRATAAAVAAARRRQLQAGLHANAKAGSARGLMNAGGPSTAGVGGNAGFGSPFLRGMHQQQQEQITLPLTATERQQPHLVEQSISSYGSRAMMTQQHHQRVPPQPQQEQQPTRMDYYDQTAAADIETATRGGRGGGRMYGAPPPSMGVGMMQHHQPPHHDEYGDRRFLAHQQRGPPPYGAPMHPPPPEPHYQPYGGPGSRAPSPMMHQQMMQTTSFHSSSHSHHSLDSYHGSNHMMYGRSAQHPYGMPGGVPMPPPPPPPQAAPAKMIEISPNCWCRLRGADETWACIERSFYTTSVMCFGCGLHLCCIQDADYVLCPSCRVVSPINGIPPVHSQGGVGLGFTHQDLAQWQQEIAVSRQPQHHHHHAGGGRPGLPMQNHQPPPPPPPPSSGNQGRMGVYVR